MSKTFSAEWKIARTMAHLWINGNYSGVSVSLKHHNLTPAILAAMNLPALPPQKARR